MARRGPTCTATRSRRRPTSSSPARWSTRPRARASSRRRASSSRSTSSTTPTPTTSSKMRSRGVIAVEMEAAALFYLAMREQGKRQRRPWRVHPDRQRHAREGRRTGRRRLHVARGARGGDAAHDRGRAGGGHRRLVDPDRHQPDVDRRHVALVARVGAASLKQAGFAGVWCWDHFISRGRKIDPVLECWTTLTAAAAHTSRTQGRQLRDQRHEPPPGRPGAHAGDALGPVRRARRAGHRRRRLRARDAGVRHRVSRARRALRDPGGGRGR